MTVLTPHDKLSSTLKFVGTINSVAEHESLDWAPAQDSHFWRSPTSAPVSCFEEKLNNMEIAINLLYHDYIRRVLKIRKKRKNHDVVPIENVWKLQHSNC